MNCYSESTPQQWVYHLVILVLFLALKRGAQAMQSLPANIPQALPVLSTAGMTIRRETAAAIYV